MNGTSLVDIDETSSYSPQPFHIIGHRVLVKQGIYDAISNGANTPGIHMTAQRAGWWADHDRHAFSRGDTARTMFESIAALRDGGRIIRSVERSTRALIFS